MINDYSFEFEYPVTTKEFVNALRANVVRSRTAITVVFPGLYNVDKIDITKMPKIEEKITDFFRNETRKYDFVFKITGQPKWFIVLSQSGEREAAAFIRRLNMTIRDKGIPDLEDYELLFSASVAEIGNDEGTFEELLAEGMLVLEESLIKGPEQIEYITTFKKRPTETIRVSILEENAIFRNVLHRTIENLDMGHFETEIKEFEDGYEFLESNWYLSSHIHLIITNDILPRQSGLDVLHKVRMLPNTRRLFVFMMTKGSTEEDMIYAYESGADSYFIKPFNLRLLEVEIKRTLERLWS
ncbi:MAG: response regulator [Clostridiaceae bacterium]|nr:response regulator [Clostridiaceae bacterium]